MEAWVTSIRRWAIGGDFADGKHTAGIAVEAVFFNGQVDVDDVAFFQRLVIGNAVADNVVDGGAAGFRIGRVAVVEGGWITALNVDVVSRKRVCRFRWWLRRV